MAMISQSNTMDIDEAIIVEQVKATHDPKGGMDVDASSILDFLEDIYNFDTAPREAMQEKLILKEHMPKEILFHLLQLSFKVASSCLNNVDSHLIAICLLSTLSMYPWHTKVVMMLASFAIIYGKFEVVSQSCEQRKKLAYNLPLSRQMRSSNSKRPMDNSIKYTFDLAKLMVELQHSSPMIESAVDLAKLMVELHHSSLMIVVNYWIARFVVVYTPLYILGPRSQNKLTEQSNLSTKIKEIMTSFHLLLEAKRAEENYQALLHAFDNSSNILEVLKLIFNVRSDKEKSIDARLRTCKNPISYRLDTIGGEGVLLLISSGKHFPYYAYNALTGVKMVWIHITNAEEEIQDSDIPFYVFHPRKPIAQEFRRFLKEKCFQIFHVGSDPIIISLDRRGRLVHFNALHMILTWRDQLYRWTRTMSRDLIPSLDNELRERTLGADLVIDDIDTQIHVFANEVRENIRDWVKDIMDKVKSSIRFSNYISEREQALWDKESWNLKLVASDILYRLNKWIDNEEYIFLCGGNANKQVQEFTVKIQEVCSKTQMNMKITYVGRSEKVKVEMERVGGLVFSSFDIKKFWRRLQSMALSRIQYLIAMGLGEGNDEIMQGLKKLLAYEAEGSTVGVWALLSKGNRIIACDMGEKMLGVMNEYEKWKDNAQAKGFEQAFRDCYEMLSHSSHTSYQHPCCSLNYPSNFDKILDTESSCPQCNHNMHKFVTFSCCHTFEDC